MVVLVVIKGGITEELCDVSSPPVPEFDKSHFCSYSVGLTTEELEDMAELVDVGTGHCLCTSVS